MQLLLTERAFASFGDRVAKAAPRAEFVRMQDDGTLLTSAGPLDWADVHPTIAWLTADLFDDGPIRPFFKLALDSKPQWLHFSGAGTDHPVFQSLLDGGTRLTSSRATPSRSPSTSYGPCSTTTSSPTAGRRRAPGNAGSRTTSVR